MGFHHEDMYDGHEHNRLLSLEWYDELLCEDDLWCGLCGMSWQGRCMRYACDEGNYPFVLIWNGLCRNAGNWSCSVCENVDETLNDFTCPCPHSHVWNLTWHGDFCVVWIGDALQEFLKEVSYAGNPLQCDHSHHIQNT